MSEDSLVATRARRANAGSRLKRLIELEEQTIEERQSIVYTEDDENVNLLFQEDENDEEFEDSEEDGEGEGDEDDDEDDGGEEGDVDVERGDDGRSDEGEDSESGAGSKKRTIEKVDADDVLSDSEISETDSDQSEGEKELDKQEKLKQRKLKKKNKLIPTIKQPRPPASVKKVVKKPKLEFTSQSLLNAKRSSSRSAVVESKQALAKRLKADEERRALLKPVVRVKEVEMTQEERLAEAVETERANVRSLNEFREQEIVKKETQRQMLMLKRVKLVNVIRMVSEEHFITPFDEITEARRVFEKENLKSKRKPGRKKKNMEEVEQQQAVLRPPGSIDLDLPLVKEEMERERIEKEKRALEEKERREAEEKEKLENGEVDTILEEQKGEEEKENTLESIKDEAESKSEEEEKIVEVKEGGKTNEVNEKTVETEEDGKTNDADENGSEEVPDAAANEDNEDAKNDNKNEAGEGELKPNEDKDANTGDHDTNLEDETNIGGMEVDDKADSKVENSEAGPEIAVKEEETVIQDGDKMDTEEDNEIKNEIRTEDKESLTSEANAHDLEFVKTEDGNGDKGEKRVKFVDDLVDGEKIEVTATPEPEGTPNDDEEDTPVVEKEIFEGPAERVSRNMIYLIDFDDEKEHKLIDSNIKTILFGKQSLLPASRRFKDLKQIAKIGESENPYLTIIHRKDELFEPVTNLTENDSLFEELKRLPRFGDFEDIVEEEEVNDEEVTSEIVLKTEAPTSLYLPNGNKKNCLITGTEVKYFDPANGIPYSSVETYRLLKQIEQGNVPWYSFGNDANDGGGAELYLGMREGARHAKGVPEGFDA